MSAQHNPEMDNPYLTKIHTFTKLLGYRKAMVFIELGQAPNQEHRLQEIVVE